jgi:hypothetical protein
MRSSGVLHSLRWHMFTDVLVQPIRSIFKSKAAILFRQLDCWWWDSLGCSETSVNNYRPTQRNTPRQWKLQLHPNGNLKCSSDEEYFLDSDRTVARRWPDRDRTVTGPWAWICRKLNFPWTMWESWNALNLWRAKLDGNPVSDVVEVLT